MANAQCIPRGNLDIAEASVHKYTLDVPSYRMARVWMAMKREYTTLVGKVWWQSFDVTCLQVKLIQ